MYLSILSILVSRVQGSMLGWGKKMYQQQVEGKQRGSGEDGTRREAKGKTPNFVMPTKLNPCRKLSRLEVVGGQDGAFPHQTHCICFYFYVLKEIVLLANFKWHNNWPCLGGMSDR